MIHRLQVFLSLMFAGIINNELMININGEIISNFIIKRALNYFTYFCG